MFAKELRQKSNFFFFFIYRPSLTLQPLFFFLLVTDPPNLYSPATLASFSSSNEPNSFPSQEIWACVTLTQECSSHHTWSGWFRPPLKCYFLKMVFLTLLYKLISHFSLLVISHFSLLIFLHRIYYIYKYINIFSLLTPCLSHLLGRVSHMGKQVTTSRWYLNIHY